jgi:hypothetical protein
VNRIRRALILAPAVILAFAATGCVTNKQVLRSELQLQGDSGKTLEGLTVSAKVLGLDAVKGDPRLTKNLEATRVMMGVAATTKTFVTLVNPPVFEVRIMNKTGHVVRLDGTVIKLLDGGGNVYDAITKDVALTELNDSFDAGLSGGVVVGASERARAAAGLKQLKFLGDNVTLLPDVAETFIAAFALPIQQTEEGLNEWLAAQTSLRLKVFDVPVEVNAAGAVTKRVSFEYPIVVRSFRETYEVGPGGKKLLATEEVQK